MLGSSFDDNENGNEMSLLNWAPGASCSAKLTMLDFWLACCGVAKIELTGELEEAAATGLAAAAAAEAAAFDMKLWI